MAEFRIEAMNCSHGVAAVTEAIRRRDPQASVEVGLATKIVHVDSARPAAELVSALAEAGYPPN